MATDMHPNTAKALEEIDAAVFSSDFLWNKDNTQELITYMGRWTRSIRDHKNMEAEILRESHQTLIKVLESVEWSASTRGQGSGMMGSGGDGPLVRACPVCGGIDTSDPRKREFNNSTHGHRDDCSLKTALDEAKEHDDDTPNN